MASRQVLKLQNTLNPEAKVFQIERSAAEHSAVIRMVLEDFDEAELADAVIPVAVNASDACLARIVEWMLHGKDMPKANDDADDADDAAPYATVIFTSWDEDFFSTVDSQMLYDILITANYLEIKLLYNMACQVAVNMIRGKSTEEIREILNIENDFTPEEEEAIRRETEWAYDREQE